MVGEWQTGPRTPPFKTPWTCWNWAPCFQPPSDCCSRRMISFETSSTFVFVFWNTDNSSGTWPLISFRWQGLKEKWNYRFEQFVPVIVKSISDFIVGTMDLFCLYVVLSSQWKESSWLQDGLQVAVRAWSRSPAKNHLLDSPWHVFCVCLYSLKKKNGFTFILYSSPHHVAGRTWEGMGTLWTCQEVLYPEKQILHDWTAIFVLYCLCFFLKSFTFLSTLSSPSSTPLLFFLLGLGRENIEFLDKTKQNKTLKYLYVLF